MRELDRERERGRGADRERESHIDRKLDRIQTYRLGTFGPRTYGPMGTRHMVS